MMNTIDTSLPRSITVRGQTIQRMPLGKYLQAMAMLERFPREAAARLVPDGEIAGALEALKTLNRDRLIDLILKALAVVPRQAAELIAALTDIPVETLLHNEQIGADGLMEILDAWLEVNAAENFIRAAGHLRQKISRFAAMMKPGSKG